MKIIHKFCSTPKFYSGAYVEILPTHTIDWLEVKIVSTTILFEISFVFVQ